MKSIRNKILLLLLLSASCSSAFAVVYDLKNDWSTTTNPNGAWTYMVGGSVATSSIAGNAPYGIAPVIWGGLPSHQAHQGWSQSNGTEVYPHDWQTGDIFAHTFGGNQGLVSIVWTSTSTGMVDLLGSTWLGRDIGRQVTWDVLFNGSSSLAAGLLSSGDAFDSSSPLSFSATGLSVNVGDTIIFNAQSADTGDFFGLNMNIDLTPTSGVPDTGSTLALLGAALFGLAGIRRK